jgi:uncharacterized cupin superfamily protein
VSANVTTIDPRPPEDSFVPTNVVAPGCLISGTPNDRGVTQFTSDDGSVTAGVWTCDTYREVVPRYPADELCVVLEGSVTVIEDGHEPCTYGVGDAFVIRRGTACTWDATGPFRKFFMEYDPDKR